MIGENYVADKKKPCVSLEVRESVVHCRTEIGDQTPASHPEPRKP